MAALARPAVLPRTAGICAPSLSGPSLRTAWGGIPAARLRLVVAANASGDGGEKLEPSGWSGNVEKALFGENVGARDVTRGEKETNFSNNVWFNWDTEHIVKPPDALASVLGLKSRTCKPLGELEALSDDDCERLRNQVPGWRLDRGESGKCIKTDLRIKDPAAGEEMVNRLNALAEENGHKIHGAVVEAAMVVKVELCTPSVGAHVRGGLSENDFIIAYKVNDMDKSDLSPPKRQRFWA